MKYIWNYSRNFKNKKEGKKKVALKNSKTRKLRENSIIFVFHATITNKDSMATTMNNNSMATSTYIYTNIKAK